MTIDDLKAARKYLALSQSGLAQAMGVSIQSVQAWEQGARPVPEYAARLIKFLTQKSDNTGKG